MSGSKSKQKGNSYERQLAKFLSELYGESFIRVPNSGAYVGGSNALRKQVLNDEQVRAFKGDIMPGHSFSRLQIEAKSYSDFPFHQLFTGNAKLFDSWIDQALASEDPSDLTMICMKFNRKGQFVAIKSSTPGLHILNSFKYDSNKYGSWIIMEASQFWKMNADVVRSVCEELKEKSKINA